MIKIHTCKPINVQINLNGQLIDTSDIVTAIKQ